MKIWIATTENDITYAFVEAINSHPLKTRDAVAQRMMRGMFGQKELVITQFYLEHKEPAPSDPQMAFIMYPDGGTFLMGPKSELYVASNKGHLQHIGSAMELGGEFLEQEVILSYHTKWGGK